MGQPIDFDGSNVVMRAPSGAENVQDMHVYRTRHSCVSCWTFTPEELAEINQTGRVFLSVLTGGQQPPVYVGSESTCREVMVDFGPVWPMPPRPPAPVQHKPSPGKQTITGETARGERCELPPLILPPHKGEAYASAEAAFADYFTRNYPGPDTFIYDPAWHAPKIFYAAFRALAAPPSQDELAPEDTAISTCEACGKHVQEGEPYLWGPETDLCGECAPTYQALIDEPEGFVNADGEPLTPEQCRAWFDEHIAAGGKPTDSMAKVDRMLPTTHVEGSDNG